MNPLTLDDAERRLRAAIEADSGVEVIEAYGVLVDRLDPPKKTPSMIEAALWYALGADLRVFPCARGSKIPHAGTHGVDDATTDRRTITRWWESDPHSNIAIATGRHVDVIDIDGAEGMLHFIRDVLMCPSCRQLGTDAPFDCEACFTLDDYGVLGIVSTPRPGGLHLYVPATEGIRNGVTLVPHVDLRAAGGYVVAPPSSTDVGAYSWARTLDVDTMLGPDGRRG